MRQQLRNKHARTGILAGLLFTCAIGAVTLDGASALDYGPEPELQKGLHYYSIKEPRRGQVLTRGKAGNNGMAFDTLLLAPETFYRVGIIQASTLKVGFAEFTTPQNGQRFNIPRIFLLPDRSPDSDGDGLPNLGESILGTDPSIADTDGDGVNDRAEVQQGTNPLDGKQVQTGVIGTLDTPGTAVDICALNDLVIIADAAAGISVLNVFNAMTPTLIAQVDTPGIARAVASSGNLIAVADDTAGLAIVDISDPPAARITRQIALGSAANAVTVAGNTAFVGLISGMVASVDLLTGEVLDQLSLSGAVHDLAINGDQLYALTDGSLYTLTLDPGFLESTNAIAAPGVSPSPRRRLFAAGNLAYAGHARGYNLFDLSNPSAPRLLKDVSTTQIGWKQIVANGSGLGIAADGPNRSDDGPHDISLYDLSPNGTGTQFLTTFETPGIATALAIYNGLAYVADGTAGLQVINFLAYDNKGVAPTITLNASFALNPAQAEEGKLARLTASVADDVQVRNVEFYLDGLKVATDGNFPFEHRFVTPVLSPGKTNFTVRATATDTGGNSTWTDTIAVKLTPDATPPRIRSITPAANAIAGSIKTVTVYFNEPINPAGLTSSNLQVRWFGPDNVPDNADDRLLGEAALAYRDALKGIVLEFPTNLVAGYYRATVNPPIADLAGNLLVAAHHWRFQVISGTDSDHDGVPDEFEATLGLNPFNSDSNGNGIIDGFEDFDNDRLVNVGEVILATDPRNPRSIDPATLDGDLDRDLDSLSDALEIRFGTNPFLADSDNDGWNDEVETTTGSDPWSAESTPDLPEIAYPPLAMVLPGESAATGFEHGPTIAQPPVAMSLTTDDTLGGVAAGVTVAYPPLAVVLTTEDSGGGLSAGTTVAQPPLAIALPVDADVGGTGGTVVAQPPVRIDMQTNNVPSARTTVSMGLKVKSPILPGIATTGRAAEQK